MHCIKPTETGLNDRDEVYMVVKDAAGKQVAASNPAVAPRFDFTAAADGDFTLAASGDKALSAILPPGIYTHSLSEKLNGALRSPMLGPTHKHISFQVLGDNAAAVRLVSNNCQLNYRNYRYLTKNELHWITFPIPANADSLRVYAELMTKFDNPKFPDQLGQLGGVEPEGGHVLGHPFGGDEPGFEVVRPDAAVPELDGEEPGDPVGGGLAEPVPEAPAALTRRGGRVPLGVNPC